MQAIARAANIARMDTTILGRTGLRVSVMGLGTGGPSRIGQRDGDDPDTGLRLVRTAIDRGVNFIDSAEAYRTEAIVGRAIADLPRHDLVLSTKLSDWKPLDAQTLGQAIERRLQLLGTDYLDVCHFHGVRLADYDDLVDRLYPAVCRAREQGKVRFLGVTEGFNSDPGHDMLQRAVRDELWDVVMVGYNVLNPSARPRVLAATRDKRIGTLAMFAVRLALSRPQRLREVVGELVERGQLQPDALRECGGSPEDPLGWVLRESDATSLVDAAYRFVRHTPGIDVTLSGTGSVEHLVANIASLEKPPLPEPVVARLQRLFAAVDTVSAQ